MLLLEDSGETHADLYAWGHDIDEEIWANWAGIKHGRTAPFKSPLPTNGDRDHVAVACVHPVHCLATVTLPNGSLSGEPLCDLPRGGHADAVCCTSQC